MSIEVEMIEPIMVSSDTPEDNSENLAPADNAANDEYTEVDGFEGEAEATPELSAREQIAKDFQDKHRQFEGEGSNDDAENNIDDQKKSDTINADQPVMVAVKVNGREIQVEQDKIDKAGGIQAYQKEVAVSQGFQDVAHQKKELAAREAELAERERKLLEKSQALPTLDETHGQNSNTRNTSDLPTGDQTKLGDLITQHREALLDGDDESADSLMNQMLSIRQTPALDTDAIASQAADKTAAIIAERNRNHAILTAQDDLFTAHPELKTDARLFAAVDDETVMIERENPGWTPTQILNEAFSKVNEWRGNRQSDTAQDKANEKRSINRPRAATGRAQAPQAPRRQSNSEYIQQIRKARGLE